MAIQYSRVQDTPKPRVKRGGKQPCRILWVAVFLLLCRGGGGGVWGERSKGVRERRGNKIIRMFWGRCQT